MKTDLAIRCTCGAMEGVARHAAPATVNRVICYCQSCQAYAHALGRAGEILDEWGGTDVFQISPRHLEITRGWAHLACMRLTAKGALRWYAGCCNTPIANTLPSPRIPFVAVVGACIDWAAAGTPQDAILGPVRARVNGHFPNEQAAQLRATTTALLVMLLRYSGALLRWWLRGDHKHSPFFDKRTGKPIVAPQLVKSSQTFSQ